MFIELVNDISNLINNNKIINHQLNINYLYNLMDANIHFLSSKIRSFQKSIEKLNNEIQI